MVTDTRRTVPVSDKPAEMWAKVLGWAATIIIALLSMFGTMTIHELRKLNDYMAKNSVIIERHDGKIMRLEMDMNAVRGDVSTNTESIIMMRKRK